MADGPCLICCDEERVAEFKCPLCPQAACVDCWMTSLLGERGGMRCFGCKRPWVVETLLSAPSFEPHRQAIIGHAGDIQVEREMALLAASQDEAALQREMARLIEARRKMGTLKQVARRVKVAERSAAQDDLRARVHEIEAQQRQLRARSQLHATQTQPAATRETSDAYVQRCDDPCRGFVRASSFACSVCDRTACRRCGSMLAAGEAHRCEPELVATYEERRKNHKLCPRCHVEIYKPFGCDQMYCISCHTAFSWSTLTIDRGDIHNPEYFRYLTTQRVHLENDLENDLENVACGELPAYRVFIARVPANARALRFAEAFYACIQHIRALPLQARRRITENLDLRVAYINGEFDEDAFRAKVKHRHRRELKRDAFCELLAFVNTILVASARNMAFVPTSFADEVKTLTRFAELVEEEYIPRLLDVHGGVVPWEIGTVFTTAFLRELARPISCN